MKDKDNKNKLINLIFTLYDNDCVSLNDIYDAFYSLCSEPLYAWCSEQDRQDIKDAILIAFQQENDKKLTAVGAVDDVLWFWQKEGYLVKPNDVKEFGLLIQNRRFTKELDKANKELEEKLQATKESMQMLTTEYRLLSTMVNNMESKLMDKADKVQEITGENPLLESMNKKYSD